jgi:hypothetical protein
MVDQVPKKYKMKISLIFRVDQVKKKKRFTTNDFIFFNLENDEELNEQILDIDTNENILLPIIPNIASHNPPSTLARSILNNETRHILPFLQTPQDGQHSDLVLEIRVGDLEEKMKLLENKINELSKIPITSIVTKNEREPFQRRRPIDSSDDETLGCEYNSSNIRNQPARHTIPLQVRTLALMRPDRALLRPDRASAPTDRQIRYLQHERDLDEHRQAIENRRITSSNLAPPRFDGDRIMTQRRILESRLEEMRRSNRAEAANNLKLTNDQIERFPTSEYCLKNNGVNEDVCPICLDAYQQNDNLRIISCFDKFHKKCIDTWLLNNNKCPCCNYDLLRHLMESV